jgi:hypothetical protein
VRTGVLDESGWSSESAAPEAFEDMDGGGTLLRGRFERKERK